MRCASAKSGGAESGGGRADLRASRFAVVLVSRSLAVATLAAVAGVGALAAPAALAPVAAPAAPAASLAPVQLAPIQENDRVTLRGSVHPLARPELEVGPADPDLALHRIVLVLRRPPGAETALRRLLDEQQDPASPRYHAWLTPEEFGRRFGPADDRLAAVTGWLAAHGFRVDEVARARGWIQFSGTATQVAEAFRTPIRDYQVGGELHHANAADPSLPRALSGLVSGVLSLHDFPRPLFHRAARAVTQATAVSGQHFLAPADFATVYNVKPLYDAGWTGAGAAIAIVGRSDLSLDDVRYFRSYFGLPANDPVVIHNGASPGELGGSEEMEADLDVEWSGAVAPRATIDFVVSATAFPTDGFDLSAAYIVDHALAPIVSASYGSCEASQSASALAYYNGLWAQAAAQGMTVFAAAGDSGASLCAGLPTVSDVCSTPYDVCVGGTQLDDSPPSAYWSTAADPTTQGSALSYIPEKAWNEPGIGATGGGASAVYPKPAWQSAPGVPADGWRDVPDVALASALHDGYLIVTGHSASSPGLFAVGGTSAAAPSFAGLMALVVQKAGGAQGNANPTLYKLGSGQYASGGPAVFHDVTAGNNGVPGVAGGSSGPGYDPVTGLGSVDANALVANWSPAPSSDFGLAVTPADLSGSPGGSWTVSVKLLSAGAFSSGVALSVAGLPPGVTATLDPPSLSPPGISTLTITAAPSAKTGYVPLILRGSGGGQTHTLRVALRLLAPTSLTPSYAFSAAANNLVPVQLAAGPDGAVWFTAVPAVGKGDLIGRIALSSAVSRFPIPSCASTECFPLGIVTGPDGALWFTEADAHRIGRITTSGALSEYPLPAADAANGIPAIAAGPDGALWFLENGPQPKVGRITTSGAITTFPLPASDQPAPGWTLEPTLTAGPDGALWFTEVTSNRIGRISTSGTVVEFDVPTPRAGVTNIVAGPDGALWFAESSAMKIGRITTAGAISEYPTGFPYVDYGYGISALTLGPDGNLWFTAYDMMGRGQLQALLGRLTPAGAFTWYLFVEVVGLTPGPDGELWFISGAKIGHIPLPGQAAATHCVAGDATLCIDDQPGDARFQLQVGYQTAAGGGLSGSAHAVPLAPLGIAHGGAFWFFSADNPEMLVKVIDGCGVNGKRWLFASAGTDVGLTITVTDTRSGAQRVYRNADGSAALPIQDTGAFNCSTAAGAAAPARMTHAAAAGTDGAATRAVTGAAAGGCSPNDSTLCIDGIPGDGRFAIQVAYRTAEGGGMAGSGHAVPLAPAGIAHGGAFWFFSADNPEMLVKVIDGCAVNHRKWFFASAGTNVGLAVTVIDTQTGARQVYTNPDGTPALPIQDTSAFSSCP